MRGGRWHQTKKVTIEGTRTTTTDYMLGFEYRNDSLQQLMDPEGRTRYAKRYWQNGDSAYRWEWDYFYKDHLGNIRTTVTEQRDTANYKASMETGQNAKESAMFKRVAETRMLISGVNGHPPPDALTNPNQYTSAIGYDHTYSYGPTTTLKVMPASTTVEGRRHHTNRHQSLA
jgi:hypothetical protein